MRLRLLIISLCATIFVHNLYAKTDNDIDDGSVALLRALFGDEPDEVLTYYREGSSLYQSNKYTETLEQFDKAYALIGTDTARISKYEQKLVEMYTISGDCYFQTKDYNNAFKFWRKSADLGNLHGQFFLGSCYENGYGVGVDYKTAAVWYRKSALQGYVWAQYCLGELYYDKDGGMYNPAEALKWFKKAAEQECVNAEYMVGVCYAMGVGVAKDIREALKWMNKAAEEDYADAARFVTILDSDIDDEDDSSNESQSTLELDLTNDWSHGGTTRYTSLPSSSYLGYVRESLKEWKECQNGAITEYGAGVAIYDSYGYSYTADTPSDLKTKIKSLNDSKLNIIDVNITEDGNFVIIFDSYGYYVVGAPQSFIDQLSSCNSAKETICSASFNEGGDWVIITEAHIYASNDAAENAVLRGCELYGHVYSVSLSYNGFVSCHENGVYYINIPSCVRDAIDDLDFRPKRIKFTDNGMYIITDDKDNYTYFL